jgi:hypothetical protein
MLICYLFSLILGAHLPLFRTKKEPFEWLRSGQKTIDVRKGNLVRGENAVYLCGRKVLRLKIIRAETGRLRDVVRLDNFGLVIPSALTVADAVAYLQGLYRGYDGVFTAYYVASLPPSCGKC